MKKIFIANRGEIAVRIIRAARDLGYESAVVYTAEDEKSLYVRLADYATEISDDNGNPFLDAALLVRYAVESNADMVHPGYGFLSENAEFAAQVAAAGLIWIGPSAQAIATLGDKVSARQLAASVGAPRAEGINHPVADAQEIIEFSRHTGFPLVIKAAAGGGGRGMRIVRSEDEIADALDSARHEAVTAFGNGDCFVEMYLEHPRHVETQCLADAHGHVSIISTRDCSLQRRHQKVFEEAPAPGLTERQIKVLHSSSCDILRAAGYCGAATCEFLLSRDGKLCFLEVNTRIQVEHTVSEVVSGIDLVAEQIRVADGAEVYFEHPAQRGVAFEFRINAEDAANDFLPSCGEITAWEPASGPWVRIDSGVTAGSNISMNFDSLLAKLVVEGKNREEAIRRSKRALEEFSVNGVSTTIPFLRAFLDTPEIHRFASGEGDTYDTDWLESTFLTPERVAGFAQERQQIENVPPVGAQGARGVQGTASADADGEVATFTARVDGRAIEVSLPSWAIARQAGPATLEPMRVEGINFPAQDKKAGQLPVFSPTSAVVTKFFCEVGDQVEQGDAVATIEVMKMEYTVRAPSAGTIVELSPIGSEVSVTEAVFIMSTLER
ncbi:MAG: ATP-grasp domain-containing protein [Bifidobacterium tibiigranuli]|jgi:acetyl-CoA/propionyl-CoA carboxylase biotin carboxyl carrier protein|uniref:ATP-binding protein n=1 Tax=Bifidobacterium tibiigranuli TaxID=2172043 RepID=UPI0026ED550E|nr:biotin carboxylase N-terminal domain-containing protein [Bifidobacterium tibiigranuli]MCI1673683.1 ATP-grasp domain-containing protein [Bifidobacterium tibiigranuli]MCI1712939.1 ATP-grasp domain-containing protein [Bifidobacterium tibiigranuli]MCI1833554.1 ATP-grasp domain-containing protein [Bifidobacterium tibiigranuli]